MIYVQLPTNYQPTQITIDEIADMVCKYFDVTLDRIRIRSRKEEVRNPRHVIAYLARKHTKLSLKKIGAFTGLDHTTVINSCQIVQDMIDTGDPLGDAVATIQQQIQKKVRPFEAWTTQKAA